ncbi:hypothetical protein SPH72_05760 [Rhodobacterales bacterium FZCC0083]|nr:hypothetical protein SPH72_05760 [Rhodobacterales bacterium FZCC0083]
MKPADKAQGCNAAVINDQWGKKRQDRLKCAVAAIKTDWERPEAPLLS